MNKNKKNIIALLLTSTFLFSFFIYGPVSAATGTPKVSNWDLVDSGGHMDYTLDSKYSSHVPTSVNIWNNYIGTIIRKDTASTLADVDIYDVNEPYEIYNAITISLGEWIAGAIMLNKHYMDNYSTNTIRFIIAHELGHTLGCDENDCSTLNIMYPSTASNTSLSVHDKASVDRAKESW